MRIRIFAVLLALLLTLSLFACAEESPEGETPTTEESVTESTSAEAPKEEEPEVLTAEDPEDFKYTELDGGGMLLTGVKEKKIVSCKLPEGVVAIASGAFQGCTELESITFNAGLASVELGAFTGCSKLLQAVNGVTYAGTWAVDCAEAVTSVSLREGTVGIANSVFAGCSKLSKPTLAEGLQKIGSGAFRDCTSLIILDIPTSLTEIAPDAFEGCTSLSQVIVHEKSQRVIAEKIKQSAKRKKLTITVKKI